MQLRSFYLFNAHLVLLTALGCNHSQSSAKTVDSESETPTSDQAGQDPDQVEQGATTPSNIDDPEQSAPGTTAEEGKAGGNDGTEDPSKEALEEEDGETRTTQVVADFVKERRERVRICYDDVQRRNPELQGDIMIRFVLSPEGNVKSIEYSEDESTIHSQELADCMIAEMKTWKFPPSSKGMESSIGYPFNFNPR